MAKLVLISANKDKRIQAIKAIRALTGLGLKEAKEIGDDLISGAPKNVVLLKGDASELEEKVSYLAENSVEARIETDADVENTLLAARLAVVAIYRGSDPVDVMARLRDFAKVGAGDAFQLAAEIIDQAIERPRY